MNRNGVNRMKKSSLSVCLGIIVFLAILFTFATGKYFQEVMKNKTILKKLEYCEAEKDGFVRVNKLLLKQLNDCRKRNYELSHKSKVDVNKDKYVEWILNNSSKCPRSLAKLIVNECSKYKNFKILLAIIQRESSFNPFECSKANARGLGQIRPFYYDRKGNPVDVWGQELKESNIIEDYKDLYDPVLNIKATNYILTKYLDETGSLKKALYKYVGGKKDNYVYDILKNIGELAIL